MTSGALPRESEGPRPAFFEAAGVDQLVSMVLELTAEIWTLRERIYVGEALAGAGRPADRSSVDAYKLSDAERAELAGMRRELTQRVFRSLEREHRRLR